MALILGRSLRRSDVLTRYGGEEFALVMPEAGSEAALIKLDKVRLGVAESILDLPTPREPDRLTISVGVATYPGDGQTVELLLAVADDRLLRAKREGRNRVVGSGVPGSTA